MNSTLTISEIEQAINFWRSKEPANTDSALCARARVLAEVYGMMIYDRATSVAASRLTPEQLDAVRVALHERDRVL